jgi:hypothetical protein
MPDLFAFVDNERSLTVLYLFSPPVVTATRTCAELPSGALFAFRVPLTCIIAFDAYPTCYSLSYVFDAGLVNRSTRGPETRGQPTPAVEAGLAGGNAHGGLCVRDLEK